MAATPAEIQKAEQFKNTQARGLEGAIPLRTAPREQQELQSEGAPGPLFSEEPGITPPASPQKNALEEVAQTATAGLLRSAWSSLPFGLLNPFLGLVSLTYINIHFIFAYLGGPISLLFGKFGTEWLEQLGAARAGGAALKSVGTIKETAAGQMLATVLEFGEIFVLLVLDALVALAVLLLIALAGALLQTIGSPILPGLTA